MRSETRFYVWFLPVVWGVCSYAHHYYPGDENALWLVGSAAGWWMAPFVFFGSASKTAAALGIAAAGALVMALVGWGMDRFSVRKRLWGPLYGLCTLSVFAAAVLSYGSIERALAKNGSWWAYILFACLMGMYLSVALSVVATGAARAVRLAKYG